MKARHLDKYMPQAINGVRSEGGSGRTAAYLDQRNAERVPLHAYVSYVTDARMGLSRGQGWLVDLAKTGCQIRGPVLMVGTHATLVLYFSDEQDPLCITTRRLRGVMASYSECGFPSSRVQTVSACRNWS